MILFVVVLTVMAILMGVAVQTAEFAMQREREEELIFRGGQYVEAIRLFQKKYGRLPVTLKELWEADPKVIRRKFKDPIRDSEEWDLIFFGEGGRQVGRGRRDTGLPTPTPTPTPPAGRDQKDRGDTTGGPGNKKQGPFIGVKSYSCEDSIKEYQGNTTYCKWEFKLEQQQGQQGGPGRGPNPTPTPSGPGNPRRTPVR
jgi:type II secretory pathway pseudopilin PulG